MNCRELFAKVIEWFFVVAIAVCVGVSLLALTVMVVNQSGLTAWIGWAIEAIMALIYLAVLVGICLDMRRRRDKK